MSNNASFDSIQNVRAERGLQPLRWCESCGRRPAPGWVKVGEAVFHVCQLCAEDRRWNLETGQ